MASHVSSQAFATLEGNVNCIALFNHEEIGSVSTSGAESSLIPSLLHRLSPSPQAAGQSIARSFLVSCDVGHAIHPNYSSKHEENHAPRMNGGVVIKTNASQRYASDAIGSFVIKKLIEKKGGNVQEYEVRNDMYVHHPRPAYSGHMANEYSQGMWFDRRPHALQDRYPYRRHRTGDPLYALHPGTMRRQGSTELD